MLVDDHEVVREGLRTLVGRSEGMTVAAEAGLAPAATAARRRRGSATRDIQVRIYPEYRVDRYLALVPRRMY